MAMEKASVLHKCLKMNVDETWNPTVFQNDVAEFFQVLRDNLKDDLKYTNKLHILEHHLAELVYSHGVLGPYSEQASESLHYLLEQRMENFKNKKNCQSNAEFEAKKLKYSMKVQNELVYLNDSGLLY